jgi:GrpB-like predicted nucleotidyltransferase (UPF0157 family)/GNAT superfamily N-acetyltransferase
MKNFDKEKINDVHIRKFKREDIKYIMQLFHDTVHSVNSKDYTQQQLNAWAHNNMQEDAWIKSIEENLCYVALQDNIIVGFADISNHGYLDRIFVHKDHQRQGIAKNLFVALESHASSLSLHEITTEASITAVPFFKKQGFSIIYEQVVKKGGEQLTNFKMSKELAHYHKISDDEKINKVEVLAYNPEWVQKYINEAKILKKIFGDKLHSIHHIGSTAIIGAHAKPIIDIMPIFFNIADVNVFNAKLEAINYEPMGEYGIPGRRYFWKSKSQRSHHLHAFQIGDQSAHKHLIFRDYMNNYPIEAEKYSALKIALAKKHPNDIVSYVNGKTGYVGNIHEKIKKDPIAANYDPIKDRIILVPFDPNWGILAKDEIDKIKLHVKSNIIIDIQHFGSTAIKGISAKPIIDILIGVKNIKDGKLLIKSLEDLEYQYWEDNPDKTKMFFVKGMPPKNLARTHHVHVVEHGDDRWVMRTLFSDYLNANPSYAYQYQQLKLELAEFYTYDREAYTILKSDFIKKILQKAGFKGEVKR